MRTSLLIPTLCIVLIGVGMPLAVWGQAEQQRSTPPQRLLIDDFESYGEDTLPTQWKYLEDRRLVPLEPRHMRPKEQFYIVEEANGNRILQVYTDGEAVHLTMANEPEGFDWDLEALPYLQWDWRALELPPGGNEEVEAKNDTGAGVYVAYYMSGRLFKRPVVIKYSYSSSLPVGTVVSYGKLKVIVVSSALDGVGEWQTIRRNVVEDYKMLFGKEPPRRPMSLRLWGDSDNTKSVARADFDNIMLLAEAP